GDLPARLPGQRARSEPDALADGAQAGRARADLRPLDAPGDASRERPPDPAVRTLLRELRPAAGAALPDPTARGERPLFTPPRRRLRRVVHAPPRRRALHLAR